MNEDFRGTGVDQRTIPEYYRDMKEEELARQIEMQNADYHSCNEAAAAAYEELCILSTQISEMETNFPELLI